MFTNPYRLGSRRLRLAAAALAGVALATAPSVAVAPLAVQQTAWTTGAAATGSNSVRLDLTDGIELRATLVRSATLVDPTTARAVRAVAFVVDYRFDGVELGRSVRQVLVDPTGADPVELAVGGLDVAVADRGLAGLVPRHDFRATLAPHAGLSWEDVDRAGRLRIDVVESR